jgi:prepilin-type N-terminal cleavage/methylation domain-containing protein
MRETNMSKPMKTGDEAGFTLTEIMITVMIVGILAAFTAPQLSGLLRSYRLSGAARLVWTDLHKAKMTAIKERRRVRVDFTPASYNIVRELPPAPEQVILSRNLSDDYLGITVSLVGAGQSVSFDSTGTVLPPSKTVQIQGPSGGKSFTVLATGRIGKIS